MPERPAPALLILWFLVFLPGACAHRPVQAEAPARPASFSLRLTQTGLRPDDVAPLRAFLDEAEAVLPPRVKARLGQPLAVRFEKLDSSSTVEPPPCTGSPSAEPVRGAVLGRLDPGRRGLPAGIVLHRGLVEIVRAGAAAARRYPCGHRTLYRLALAALVHEVLHVYDTRARLSEGAQYLALHRFVRAGASVRRDARNLLRLRSADPYELASPAESLAVNGEYFLLDPEYRCRVPASYLFFERTLGLRPFADRSCAPRNEVYDGAEPLPLDPARVYAVHFLWASPGRGIESGFGHAMLRIVLCAERRPSVDAACLGDIQDHLVLNFSANTRGDSRINPVKGLLGGYPMQLFVRPLPDVLIEYTERELRDLYSFPLRLRADEIRTLVQRAREIFWTYSSRYWFASNNCGSETLALIEAALVERPAIRRPWWALGLGPWTPRDLRDWLLTSGLAEPLPAQGLADFERQGLFFPSTRRGHEAAFERLRLRLGPGLHRTLDRFLDESRVSERRLLLQRLAELGRADAEALADLYALEGLVLLRRQQAAEERLIALYFRRQDDPRFAGLRDKVQRLIARGELYQPWLWPRTGYGVPLASDRIDVPRPVPPAFLAALRREALGLLVAEYPTEQDELAQTERHRRELGARLIAALPKPPEQHRPEAERGTP